MILKLPHGDILPPTVSCDFVATNNGVEYKALIMGLQLAKDLQVYIDSFLITNHFNGSYTTKGERKVS